VSALLADPAHHAELDAECERLLRFAVASRDPDGGFGHLDAAGRLDRGAPVELWLTCRMTHVFALGRSLGFPGSGELVGHGLAALTGPLRDARHGGWFASVRPEDRTKQAYGHAFVVLAASSAGDRALLDEALSIVDRRFWRDADGLVVDACAPDWSTVDPYRGVNANMHTVEAFLAAADATGDAEWRRRALRITERVVHGFARDAGWMLPEHYTAGWAPLPDHNRDRPGDPFRPYGVTPGHLLEWSRLALGLRAALGPDAPGWLLPDAVALFDAAVATWDGGFPYTVDFDGTPVVRQRMHWVVAEALGAAATLWTVTGEDRYDDWYARFWAYARDVLIDRAGGSWWHEVDPDGRPAGTVWPGKPDAYHAVQAVLIPRLPVAPTIAAALRRRAT
jgi:sulfoquinovose isomerase